MSLTVFCAEENEERNIEKVWEFDKKYLTLTCLKHPYYEIDLEWCSTGSAVMDWIFQINMKAWMTPKIMFSFLKEFESCFHKVFGTNAQAMCAMGNDFFADWKAGEIIEK